MKEKFKDIAFKADSLERIAICEDIIVAYQAMGLRLTLRQLYYQLVTKNVIPNVEKSYKALSSLVSNARLAGLLDWDAIEDRVRRPEQASQWSNIPSLVESALYAYRLPRWRSQENYVELWVEKDALAGVLSPIAHEYHITLMVNRGYSSSSAMYESAKRFNRNRQNNGSFDMVLLYLGDHDPSGEDMVRDVEERLHLFGADVEVEKIALTPAQILQFKPPPNPAKLTDPRAKEYIEKHGDSSWEVDALPPEVLTRIIETRLDELVEKRKMDHIKSLEEEDKRRLKTLCAESFQ